MRSAALLGIDTLIENLCDKTCYFSKRVFSAEGKFNKSRYDPIYLDIAVDLNLNMTLPVLI